MINLMFRSRGQGAQLVDPLSYRRRLRYLLQSFLLPACALGPSAIGRFQGDLGKCCESTSLTSYQDNFHLWVNRSEMLNCPGKPLRFDTGKS